MPSKIIDRDWAKLAKDGLSLETPPPQGFVHIGDGEHGLKQLFGQVAGFDKEDSAPWEAPGDRYTGLSGGNNKWHYAANILAWESHTGLNYAQTIASPVAGSGKIATEYCNGLYNTLRLKFEDKLYAVENRLSYKEIKFLYLDGNSLSTAETLEEGTESVSLSAFIARVEALQSKPKSVTARVDGVMVTVDGGGLAIGCKFISHEEFQKIKAAVGRKREVEIVNTEKGMAVEISGSLISGGDLDFSFSEFDQIHELVKQVGKLS